MSWIVIDQERCKGCGLCTLVCPYDLVRISDHFNEKGYRPAELVDTEGSCSACASCATMCPDVAITVYRTPKQHSSDHSARTELPIAPGLEGYAERRKVQARR